jgi:hypothetical protein
VISGKVSGKFYGHIGIAHFMSAKDHRRKPGLGSPISSSHFPLKPILSNLRAIMFVLFIMVPRGIASLSKPSSSLKPQSSMIHFMSDEQLELAEESQALAKEAVEQSIQRQQLGTAVPFELFQAQEIYLSVL